MKYNIIEGEKTHYCRNIFNNHIVSKNNVNSQYFSNISKNVRNAQRLSSGSPRFLNGITVYGNILPTENNNKKYYVSQSLRLVLASLK